MPITNIQRRLRAPFPVYTGVVVDNDDPARLLRVRVRVVERHGTKIPDDKLPWAAPIVPPDFGAGNAVGGFHIPQVGVQVLVIFPNDDIHTPFYFGRILSKNDKWESLSGNYPGRYGFRDPDGNYVLVDTVDGWAEMRHHSGTYMRIEDSGDVFIHVSGSLTMEITQGWNVTVYGNTSIDTKGSTMITSGSDVSIDGANILLNCGGGKTGASQSPGSNTGTEPPPPPPYGMLFDAKENSGLIALV